MSESDDLTIDCLIPARGGSKGVPKKNIKILGKLPLIVYSIKVAKKSKYIRRVFVTTDDQEIANISIKYGAEVLYLRPKDISTDESIDIDFFKYHTKYLSDHHLDVPDLIVHLRPTTPFRDVSVIDDAIEFFKKDKRATSLRSANICHLTPYKIFKKDGMYMKPLLSSNLAVEFYNLPRQAFEETYVPNGYVDIVQPNIFMSSNILHGDNILLYKTQEIVDIDTIEDFNLADQMLKKKEYKI